MGRAWGPARSPVDAKGSPELDTSACCRQHIFTTGAVDGSSASQGLALDVDKPAAVYK